LYPGGVLDNVGDNVSLYLDCRDATEEHAAYERHTFRLLITRIPMTATPHRAPHRQKQTFERTRARTSQTPTIATNLSCTMATVQIFLHYVAKTIATTETVIQYNLS
jgi:hypothetical protein